MKIEKIKNIVLDAFFPRFCLGCGREGSYICDKCALFVSEVEAIYFEQKKYGLDALIGIWEYEGLIKKLIHEIKHQGLSDIIKELISLIDIEIYYPYITYVPMYLKREKGRGFNQAKLIGKELAKKSDCQVISLLEKIKDTKSQMELTQEEKLENIKNCFALKGDFSGIEEVLLVDDVFITGSTMRECAKVLKKAGIKRVWGFVLARTA
jgi:ComF family protein